MEGDGLSNEQTDTLLQFQELSNIDDVNVCRELLTRHQWDLEVAFHEHLNRREGRPGLFAGPPNARAPAVVNDRFLQQVFTAQMNGGRTAVNNALGGIRGIPGYFGYMLNAVIQYFYSTISRILHVFFNLGLNQQRVVTDPMADVTQFINSYNEQFPEHPVFYQGTYAQALNDSKSELRFLLVYLHKTAENTDILNFCGETLADANVIRYINDHMLFWACDVSSPEGYRVMQSIGVRTYPYMVLIGMRSNRLTILGRFEGDCTPAELQRRLSSVVEANEGWLNQTRAERLERSMNQSLRREQDEAYQRSLLADEQKELQRQHEQEMARQTLEAEERARLEEQREKDRIARLKIELADRVPDEPAADAQDIVLVCFKLPSGMRLNRRFLQSHSIVDIFNYIFCHPDSPDNFEITTNFPKRVLCSSTEHVNSAEAEGNAPQTIRAFGLSNRELLFVKDLEA